jgi:SAM-dependent methyltransferase
MAALIQSDEFLKPSPLHHFHNFIVRQQILNAIKEELPTFYGTLLDIGCAQMPYKPILLAPPSRVTEYIGLDLPTGGYSHYGPFDLEWDGSQIPLDNNAVDCAIVTEVLGYCPQPKQTMKEIRRVLKPGGKFFATSQFLWPLCYPVEADESRYTPHAFERLLRDAGFTDIKLKIRGGWDASLAQLLALWACHRPRRRRYRALLAALVFPFVSVLTKIDRPPIFPKEFQPGLMITGFSATAIKSGA